MWTREELKSRAKVVLKKGYWKAFLVSLIILIVGGGSSGSSSRASGDSSLFNEGSFDLSSFLFFIVAAIFILLFIAFFRIFVGYVLEVGGRKFYIKVDTEEPNINHVMSGFKKGYLNTVLAMLWRSVLLLLWTLLLIIPGIIKHYAYAFVPYLLADNPEMKPKRAIELSNEMTDGHKFDMFVLDLSFIGWYILGALALGIGVLFVNPYRDATQAQLYIKLRGNLLRNSATSYAELNLTEVIEGETPEDEWKSVFDRDDY